MQIEVAARHASITDEMRVYARNKAQRLLKYYDKIQAIRVVLDKGGAGFGCEIIVDLAHMHDLVAQTAGDDMHAAVDGTVDRLERQLIQHKDRTRHHKGRGPNPHQPTRL